MFEQVTDEQGNVIRENFVDDMAGRDSGGEGQNPKYVALLAGFAMLYMQQRQPGFQNQAGTFGRGIFQDGSGAECRLLKICKKNGSSAHCLCAG